MPPLSPDLPVVLVSTLVVLVPTLVLIRSNMTQSKGFMTLVLQRIHSLYRTSPLLRTVAQLLPNKPPKGLPPLTRFEKVSSRAVRVLGLNPGAHTLQGTNTWLVTGTDTGGAHILVDTGEAHSAEQYIALLFDEVFPTTGTKRLSHILLTHGHGDHQGGVLRLLSELKSRNMLPLPTIYKRHMDSGGGGEHIEDQQEFTVGSSGGGGNGTTLRACYTPGHTDDHVGFVMPEEGAFLSGDCVLGCGTSVFDDLHEYMQSLRKIRGLIVDSGGGRAGSGLGRDSAGAGVQPMNTIYPGHGPVIRGSALQKIDEYLLHRDTREQQIMDVLENGGNGEQGKGGKGKEQKGARKRLRGEGGVKGGVKGELWLPSWDIMHALYGDLNIFVQMSALHNVGHHLQKLKAEGKITYRWPDLWRAN
ncbi:beta-lactamase-like protein [Ochromonadaceae sp. CCMP2298]|nr:beta-lactamase-like protein [Ochromonadaceae sp. CCMP2298]